jgi:hypothetical protein
MLLYVENMDIDMAFKVEMEHVCQYSGMNGAESSERESFTGLRGFSLIS